MTGKKRIAMIGGGSWGTALTKVLLQNNNRIHWYMRNRENINFIKKYHHNPNYLSSILLDTGRIVFHDNLNDTIREGDILIFAIPSAFIHEMLVAANISLKQKVVVSAIKGIIPGYNLILSDYFSRVWHVDPGDYCVITGPSHSEEVALERLTYLTIACRNSATAEAMGHLFRCHYVRTAMSDDVAGMEYSAVMKNIYAMAAGIAHGLGYGDNFLAVLVANAAQEMNNFLNSVYPVHRDIKCSAYLGDLMVTAYSQFSRNRIFGTMIGKGYSVRAARVEMNMVAEGYYAVQPIMEINRQYQVSLPVVEAVNNILFKEGSPAVEFRRLSELIN